MPWDSDPAFGSARRVLYGQWSGRRAIYLHVDGNRLNVGNFDETGLNCDNWNDDERNDNLGVFPDGA